MKISFTIKQRLLGVGLLSLIFVGIVSAAGYWGANNLTGAMNEITLISSAQRNVMQADMMRLALHGDVLAALQAGANQGNGEASDTIKNSILKDMEDHSASLKESIAKSAALPLHQDLKDILAKTEPAIESYMDISRAVVQQAFEDNVAANARLNEYINNFRILAGTMLALGELMDETMKESQDAAQTTKVVAKNTITVTLITALFAMTLILFLLIRSITRPLARAMQVANIVAPLALARAVGVADDALYDPRRHGSRTNSVAA